MRIQDWECVVSPDGHTRAAAHKENGNIVSIDGRLVGHCDAPREVTLWLMRPLLRQSWESGCVIGLGCPEDTPSPEAYALNPYNGEPPNKDKDVS